ncbi:MAG: ubiquinone/menaquinone biosynthesis methyltransferase, partial [Candidatus Dormibacteraceae bacterium]
MAARYDLVNTLLSGGQDARWRRLAARSTGLREGGVALDVACGSGRLAQELFRQAPGALVVGLDFSTEMLRVAAKRMRQPFYVRGDALRLPFPEQTFDAVTLAFGLRNFADPERGLGEMRRVLRLGGEGVVLEFLRPPAGAAGIFYRIYLHYLLPLLGGWVSGAPSAYRYLSTTVESYRTPEQLIELAQSAGWREPSI